MLKKTKSWVLIFLEISGSILFREWTIHELLKEELLNNSNDLSITKATEQSTHFNAIDHLLTSLSMAIKKKKKPS